MGHTGNHQYITYLRARDQEVFYIEGSYDFSFVQILKMLVPAAARTWDGEKKRWVIQKEYLNAVKKCAADYFNVVYYGEGGDFVKI